MAITTKDLTDDEIFKLKKAMIETKLMEEITKVDAKVTFFDDATIKQLLNCPKKIKWDPIKNEAYVEEEVLDPKERKNALPKRKYLNDFDVVGVEQSAKFYSSFLPESTFPVFCYGDEEKQKEYQAAYTSIVVIGCLELKLKLYLDDLILKYDFKKNRHKDENVVFYNFREILKKISSDNSLTSKILISACNYKFSDLKKKTGLLFISGLSSDTLSELSNLKIKIATIERDYFLLDREQKIDWVKTKLRNEKELKLNETINEFGTVGKIFRALKLNTECLSQVEKDGIFDITVKQVNAFYGIGFNKLPTESNKVSYNERLKSYRKFCYQQMVDRKIIYSIDKIQSNPDYVVISKR